MLRPAPATLEHVAQLAPRLRDADRRELISSTGQDPQLVLSAALGVSDNAWAALDQEDNVVFLYGVAPGGAGEGFPWMVAADAVLIHARFIARHTRTFVDGMNAHYPLLRNFADCRNTLHLRWLRWAGFTFTRITTEFSKDGTPFVEFIRTIPPHV